MGKHLDIVLKTVKRQCDLRMPPDGDKVVERLIELFEHFLLDGDHENGIAVVCGLKALSYLKYLDDPSEPDGGQFKLTHN